MSGTYFAQKQKQKQKQKEKKKVKNGKKEKVCAVVKCSV